MYEGLEQVELEVKKKETAGIVTKKVVRKNYNVKKRGWMPVLASGCILSVLLLALTGLRFAGTDFTDSVLNAVGVVVDGRETDRAHDGKIRFTGGIFSEKKCVLPAPFQKFSFDVSGANLKLIGLSSAVRPCGDGVAGETGKSGDLSWIDIKHNDHVTVRYFTLSEVLTRTGMQVNADSVLAVKGPYDPVILNVYIDGTLNEKIGVNTDFDIECIL